VALSYDDSTINIVLGIIIIIIITILQPVYILFSFCSFLALTATAFTQGDVSPESDASLSLCMADASVRKQK